MTFFNKLNLFLRKQLPATRYVLGVLALCFLTGTNSLNAQITGGTITQSNGYTIHKFTSSGTLVVPSGVAINVDVLVVAGGGGGGNNGGGGGGAGGVVFQSTAISAGSVSVTVGSGGAGAVNVTTSGSDGTASSFSSISAVGGGGGGSRDGGVGGRTGGSGGGGGGGGSPQLTGGAGTSGQGNAGGNGVSNNCNSAGGGGGGASAVGTTGQANTGGNGGAGVSNSITGTAVFYGGGGGAGITCNNTVLGTGGSGGGGNGGGTTLGTAGTPNTGGGGGGGGGANVGIGGQSGGSGVVIVRYLTPSVTIAASSTTICAGASVTFTATPTNGGTTPQYQWKNGISNVGTGVTYTTTSLASNDVITCVMTSNLANVSPTTATSAGITMVVNATVTPSVSVTANPSGIITTGTSVMFTAAPTNSGTTPTYVWKKGSTTVGTNSTTYTDAGLANGDVITCVMTSNAACASPTTATSNQITMTVTTGKYLNFDGVDDVVTATQQTTVANNFTIEFWARPTGTIDLLAQSTTGIGALSAVERYALFPVVGSSIAGSPTGSSGAGVSVGTNGVCVIEHGPAYLPSLLTWSGTISGWTHIAVVYTNKQPTLYINGVLTATGLTSVQTNVYVTTNSYGGGAYGYFSGDLDELRIWNSSLTAADISSRRNSELAGNEAGLIDYYKFNQGVASGTNPSVTTLTDATTPANNGTLTSFTLTGTASNWLAPSPVVPCTTFLTPSVAIAASPSGAITVGTSVTFTATPTNQGTTPAYVWKKGSATVGTNSATYTDAGLANGDVITCVMTSNATCVSPVSVTSTGITMVVNTTVTPSVTIAATNTTICAGTSVTFTATPTNGGTTPQYQWKNGSSNVGTGATYATTSLANNDVITCVMTSNLANASPTTATSAGITMTVTTLVISQTAATNCLGTAILSVNSTTATDIKWYNSTTLVNTAIGSTAITGTTVAGTVTSGSAANQLNFPTGVYVDGSGNIYIADQFNSRIQKWAPGATTGTTVAGTGTSGSAANQLNFPSGVYVDGAGNIYIADPYNSRIQKWAPGATTGTTVAGTGTSGSAADQLNFPTGVYVDGSGNIFIADKQNHRIQKWAPGATTGTTVAGTGTQGSAANQLNSPTGVYVDGSGNIFIADQNNHRIQKWAAGATAGTTVAGTGTSGSAANQLNYPFGVYVDGSGNIFIADQNNHRIQKWAAGATAGTTVAGTGTSGSAANQLRSPSGVYVDGSGNIFIADLVNNRIQKWAALTALNTYTPTTAGTYTAVVTAAGCAATTSNSVVVNPIVTPSVSIAASPSGAITAGTSVMFTATPTNGGTTPTYQWKKNGNNVGTNLATYTDGALANNDAITCVLTSNAACASPATATSTGITMTVTQPVATSPVTFSYTGAVQTFTVPACVTSLTVVANGAKGGNAADAGGGAGGRVTATLTVTPGQSLNLYVGGLPFNGGGVGGGPAGGGATDIRIGGTALGNRIIVAGGGGGAGSNLAGDGAGGAGGGGAGGFGGGPAGGGGSQSAGGAPGSGSMFPGTNGTAGFGGGGNYDGVSEFGGGGGGGYFGGGGGDGGFGGGGGGGSSYTNPTFVSGVVHTLGANVGNGSITFSWAPSVSVAASPSGAITAGTSVTFTATPTNGGTTPTYVWKKGSATVGTNSATYTDAGLANGDVITCVMTSNATCVSPASVTSTGITISIFVTPSVTIAATNTTICAGTSVTFTATPTNGGTTPQYQWKNGTTNVGTGATYTTTGLANNDVITCVMTSNLANVSPTTATSAGITMTVNALPVTPVISGVTTFCTGGTTTLSTQTQAGATYCWTNSSATPAWQNVGSAGFSAGGANYQSLAFNGSTPYVAYSDAANGNKATVMKYNGTVWENVGNAGFSAGIAYETSLAFNGNTPYVAYQDGGYGGKVTVMKYNGTAWENVGIAGFSAASVSTLYPSLAFNGGTPYVAYKDGGNGGKATVMKYNGTAWENVGGAGFSTGGAGYQRLAFNGSTPYVAYEDDGNGGKATVMKYNGTAWENVGSPGFSAGGYLYDMSLAFNDNTPYVAYSDGGNGEKTTVMKYNGTAWVNVGNAGFSAGYAYYQSLAFNGSTPYVAYQDYGNGRKTTVMTYNGTAWESVGSADFSAGRANYQSLAFNGSIPYVAYSDGANGNKTTVMKFGLPCLSSSNSLSVSAADTYTVTVDVNGCTATASQAVTVGTICSYTWTGATSTDWATATNWTPNGIPSPTDNVIIPTTTNKPMLPANQTIANMNLTGTNKVMLGNSTLCVNAITGGSPSSYVVTDGTGGLIIKALSTSTPTTFPIGASETSYDPLSIRPTNSVDFTAKVKTTTGAGDFSGTIANFTKTVKRQWDITPSATAGSTVLTLTNGGTAYTVVGTPKVGHYSGTAWTELAATHNSGTWTATTSAFSPFGVGEAGGFVAAVLPVELLDFTAKNTEGGNLLNWTTANEVNNKGFQVERLQSTVISQQLSGGKWDVLGFVTANGKAGTYDFTDNAPLSTSYYRLRQIDNDGRETYSKVVSVSLKGNNKLKVYPNPVTNILTVERNAVPFTNDDFQILNLLGQQVLTGKTPSGGRGLDVSVLPQGAYFLKVGTEQVKFVKQ